MKKKTSRTVEKLQLNKIAGYSLLTGATMLLAPISAKADIVHVDPEDIIVDKSNNYDIDIDNNGINDFKIRQGDINLPFSSYQSDLTVSAYEGNYISTSNGWIAKQSSSISVNSANIWKNAARFLSGTRYYSSSWMTLNGNWESNADEKYFGIKFDISGSTHYGWIRASVENNVGDLKVTIHDWAYEDQPNTSIKTGETVLPIELANFAIDEEDGAVRLNWQTASETENSGFIIQRKTVGSDWENLVDFYSDPKLAGQGTTSETHDYSWLDNSVEPGMSYQYRLGDVDHANTIVWHDAVDITVSEELAHMPAEFGLQSAFPNPFNPTLTIRYDLTESAKTSVKILDLAGQTVAVLDNGFRAAGSHELQWRADDAASGIYFVQLQSGDQLDFQKVLLVK